MTGHGIGSYEENKKANPNPLRPLQVSDFTSIRETIGQVHGAIAQVNEQALGRDVHPLGRALSTYIAILGYQEKARSFEAVILGGIGSGRSRSSLNLDIAMIHVRLPESFLAWQRQDQILQAPKLRPAKEPEGMALEGRIR